MATKKAASQKKAATKKQASAKTTVHTTSNSKLVDKITKRKKITLPSNIVNIILAEIFGTFILTLVAILPFSLSELAGINNVVSALGVGLTLSVLIMIIGHISGAHINPAVSFGLWSVRKLKTVLLPFYWGSQLLGGIMAVVVINWVANGALANLNFSHFGNFNWSIFAIELIGSAVFLFGLTASVTRRSLSAGAKALTIGASLSLGIIISGSLFTSIMDSAVIAYQKEAEASQQDAKAKAPEIPYVAKISGATLNPAVSIAATEKNISSNSSSENVSYSRFTLEVIVGTLLGAVIGSNLYVLIAGRNKHD